MIGSMRSALLAAFLLFACPAVVWAQGETREYRALVERAVRAFNSERYSEARDAFREAALIEPNARTLRGLGMSLYQLGDHVEAARVLSSALTSRVLPLSAEQRVEVERLRDVSRTRIARLRFDLSPPGLVLEIDGQYVQPYEGELDVGEGAHTIIADADGYTPTRVEVTVARGEMRDVRIALVHREGGEPLHEAPPEEETTSRTKALILLGAAAGLLTGAVVSGVFWRIAEEDSEHGRCGVNGCSDENLQRDVAGVSALVLSTAAIGTGVLGIAFLVSGDEEEPALACAPSVLGAACRGLF